jgi:hypothetical protein
MTSNDHLTAPDHLAPAAAPKLNHLNLCTSDVLALGKLFTQHFTFTTLQAADTSAMLRGSDGFLLVLTQIDPHAPPTYPYSVLFTRHISFHVGFMLDAPAHVHAKHQELQAAGWQPKPIQTFEALGAAWTSFYCPVGDGIEVEVNAYVSLPAGTSTEASS